MLHQYYVGLMSGTSMDGVDAVLVDFQSGQPKVIATHEETIPEFLLNQLHLLADPTTDDITLLGQCDRACGELFGHAVNNLLKTANVASEDIIAIGSHGQTIRHMPNLDYPFSLQIGDASTISVNTGIDTIADFRRKDIALGGQGAPLVPAFHQAIFASAEHDRIILNIGGISNITWLKQGGTDICGYDTGPGNTLLDLWFRHHHTESFDYKGQWAAAGKVHHLLLKKMLQHDYFSQYAPKSTGRELFNMAWLDEQLIHFPAVSPQDIQATLSQLTAQTIADEIKQKSTTAQIYVCGGGLFNDDLIKRLKQLLNDSIIDSTVKLGIEPQWVEAIAFSWLAYCFINRKTSNLPTVTGAKKAAILGAFYPAN